MALGLLRRLNPWTVRNSLNANSPLAWGALHGPARGLARALDATVPRALDEALRRRWRRRIAEHASGRYATSNRATVTLTGIALGRYGYDLGG